MDTGEEYGVIMGRFKMLFAGVEIGPMQIRVHIRRASKRSRCVSVLVCSLPVRVYTQLLSDMVAQSRRFPPSAGSLQSFKVLVILLLPIRTNHKSDAGPILSTFPLVPE